MQIELDGNEANVLLAGLGALPIAGSRAALEAALVLITKLEKVAKPEKELT